MHCSLSLLTFHPFHAHNQVKPLETCHLLCHLGNHDQCVVPLSCQNLDHADHPVFVVEEKQNLHE